MPKFVYFGAQGLPGGGKGAAEPSSSGEPQDEPAAGGHAGASGSGQGHDVPRALELTGSKGPTELE